MGRTGVFLVSAVHQAKILGVCCVPNWTTIAAGEMSPFDGRSLLRGPSDAGSGGGVESLP